MERPDKTSDVFCIYFALCLELGSLTEAEATILPKLAGQRLLGSTHPHSPMLGAQGHEAMPGFLNFNLMLTWVLKV